MIQHSINLIRKSVYEPFKCPTQGFDNEEEVTIWFFEGDGQGKWEIVENKAPEAIVLAYLDYCERQAELAREYLEEIRGLWR